MGILDVVNRFSEKQRRFREMEDEFRMQKKLENRQLTSDERELNRFANEEHQRRVKAQLEAYRKKEHNEIWHGKTMLETKNMFRNMPSIMHQKNLLVEKQSILNQERLF